MMRSIGRDSGLSGNAIAGDPLTKKKSLEAKLEAQRNSSVLNL